MLSQWTAGWTRRGVAIAAAVGLGVFGLVMVAVWIGSPPRQAILVPTTDGLEAALDRYIMEATRDFQFWYRMNVAVQCATILLGLAATLLTASTTAANTPQLKTPTVTVTALTAALVAVQSTFHLRDNTHTDLTAFERLVDLEARYVRQRMGLPPEGPALVALQGDVERALTRIRVERMRALANLGGVDAAPAPAGGDAKPQPGE